MNKDYGLGTRAIHAGSEKEVCNVTLATPIYQSSTFVFENCEQGGRRFAGEEDGYIYTRLANPTTAVLEARIADLEGGEACLAAASGMGAISACLWSIAGAGKHILADATLYGCTFDLMSHDMPRYGVDVEFIDATDLDAMRSHLKENTCAVYLETPANPTLKVTDIEEIAKIAHAYNPDIKVICDNTFASPALQLPLELGADIVVHSGTKYLNGHGDVIAGFIVGKKDFIELVRSTGMKNMTGAVMDPFAAFLILRGLKTFEIRMARHCESGMKVARFLESHPAVTKVHYPGLESHEGHTVAKKQMKDFGGMVSFEVKGGRAGGMKVANSLKLITVAVSLGSAESLIEHAASMTHSALSEEELEACGIPTGLLRLSVGLENADDLIADLKQALDQIV